MLQLRSHVRAATDHQGGILLDLARGQLFRCNASAALVVELLWRGADRAEIERTLRERFGLPAEEASADVATFLATLRGQGFLDEGGKEG